MTTHRKYADKLQSSKVIRSPLQGQFSLGTYFLDLLSGTKTCFQKKRSTNQSAHARHNNPPPLYHFTGADIESFHIVSTSDRLKPLVAEPDGKCIDNNSDDKEYLSHFNTFSVTHCGDTIRLGGGAGKKFNYRKFGIELRRCPDGP